MTLKSRGLAVVLALACGAALAPPWASAAPLVPQAAPLIAQATPVTATLVLHTPSHLSSRWARIQKLTYGTATSKLGTSPGGENVMWGPDYGVQVPNRSWWYLDAAKLRLAHFSDSGRYLGQVKLPKKYLAQGVYFQWADPMALSDGTVVLTSTSIGAPGLLLLSPRRTLSRVPLAKQVWPQISDGSRLYGFDEDGNRVKVNPRTGAIAAVTAFKGQGGRRFMVGASPNTVTVTRPGVDLPLTLVDADHPTAVLHPATEVAMSANGKLWVLVTAVAEVSADELYDAVGLFNVDTAGTLSGVSHVRTWYSDSDPGDGHHLGIRYGGTHPTLMFIDTDAVRVYRKK